MKYGKSITLKNGKECIIRSATGDDAQGVYDIFILTHEQTDFLASYADEADFDMEFERQFLADKEKSDNEVYLCAVVSGRIVGTAGIDSLGKNKVSHRAELGIAIDRAYWGMGIGRTLTEGCIEAARKASYAQLELEVVSDNLAAIALYESLGFKEYGRNPRGFRSRQCGWQELISMRLEL